MSNSAPSVLSAARLALAVRRLRAEKPELSLLASEPVAIVGIGCRFPGGGNSAETFWQMLHSGVDAISRIPADRWDADAYFDADPQAPGKTNGRWGSFVSDADKFDPQFFGIAPREAAQIDAQQRLLLEVAWEALWDSGRAPESLAGSSAGVYMAVYNSDYPRLLLEDPSAIGPNTSAGSSHSIASNRISYLLDLRGPSISIDTACSSSLVAVHLACQGLRAGECNFALAGGVTLHLLPEHYIAMAKMGMLAPDGRCKTFDTSADGFVPGEGCGVVVLKLLADALKDGDGIYAVIRGTAVNQDGRTNVLTAPNGLAQQAVIRAALQNAQIPAASVSYVETHGTGTSLGDPIEVEALTETIGTVSANAQPCALGAVKTNLGHLEAAAGIAGLIKAALCLDREEIPANLHYSKVNPNIHLKGTRFFLPSQNTPWKRGAEARFAATSSFGFGGTNAHIVLEEAPAIPVQSGDKNQVGPYLLPISARTPEALKDLARHFQEFLNAPAHAPLSFYEICHAAAMRRDHYEERLAVLAATREEACKLLGKFLAGESHPQIAVGQVSSDGEMVAFVCSGQGSQWARMGIALFERQPVFRAAIEECDALIRQLAGWSLIDQLSAEESQSKLGHTEYAQPAIFGVEVALARLWQSWGVHPAAVIGHSAGEVAAAHIAGILTLPEAVRVVVNRGRLMEPATGHGKMAAVHLPAAEVTKEIAGYGEKVSVAAINGPKSTVISGDSQIVEMLLEQWRERGIGARKMPVDYAFHSAQMQPYSEELTRVLGTVETHAETTPMISTVRGAVAEGAAFTAAYWGQNIRRPVLFAAAISAAAGRGLRTFLEIGPHPVLLTYVEEGLSGQIRPENLVPSLRRNQDDTLSILTSLGKMYALGAAISWSSVYPQRVPPVSLPVYPYQRKRYWVERRAHTARNTNSVHPLLGARLQSPAIHGAVYQGELSVTALPYLGDHRIKDSLLVPMTAFVEMAGAAVTETLGTPRVLTDLVVSLPLILSPVRPCSIQVVVEEQQVRIFSCEENNWKLHASARFSEERPESKAIASAKLSAEKSIAVEEFYKKLRERGLQFGPSFQVLREIQAGQGTAVGEIKLDGPEKQESSHYQIHPVLLDGCLQTVMATIPEETAGIYLPFAIDRCEIYGSAGDTVWAHVTLRTSTASSETLAADIDVIDDAGSLVAKIFGLRLKQRSQNEAHGEIYELQWQRAHQKTVKVSPGGNWLIVTDDVNHGEKLAVALRAKSCQVALLKPSELDAFPQVNFRGVIRMITGPVTESIEDAQKRGCATVLSMVQKLLAKGSSQFPQLYVLTQNAVAAQPSDRCNGFPQSSVWGLVRTIALEHPELRCRLIDADLAVQDSSSLAVEILSENPEEAIAFRGSDCYAPRLVPASPRDLHPQRLTIPVRGSIDNLASVPMERRAPLAGEVEVEVEATALNFRDVLGVLGMYPGDPGPLGLEFAGRVARVGTGVTAYQTGDRVMGIAWGSFASFVNTPAKLIAPIPQNLNFVEAVSVPNAFLTAHYCLQEVGCLKRGQRVLIHAATGGVGLAAIQVAKQIGAEIFATAGTEEKRDYLRSLGIKHVFNSRTLNFAEEIHAVTNRRGVDLVLNSLAGDFIAAGFAVLADGGHFIEIGKTGLWSQEQAAALKKQVRYSVVNLAPVIDSEPDRIQSHLALICRRLSEGAFCPLPISIFEFDDAASAFRFMAQARHIGKIVLRHRVSPQIVPDATYLLTGGLGAIGLRIAEWLSTQGAKHLLLLSRGTPSAEVAEQLNAIRASGACVEIRSADVSDRAQLSAVLQDACKSMPPLRGIFHLAGVVDDGVIAQQSWERFQNTMASKVSGTWNLHELLKNEPLDFFVLFSSLASVTGSPGQASYAAANAFEDGLAHFRRSVGLPATSLNWGAWAEAGMAARVESRGRKHALAAIRPMPVQDCLASLQAALTQNKAQLVIADVDWRQWNNPPQLFGNLISSKPVVESPKTEAVFSHLENAPIGQRRKILLDALRTLAQQVLGLEKSHFIDERQSLLKLGLDSLMAVEFRNRLSTVLKRSFEATLLFDHPTLGELVNYLEPEKETPPPAFDPVLAEIDSLSDLEAEELLKEELGHNF